MSPIGSAYHPPGTLPVSRTLPIVAMASKSRNSKDDPLVYIRPLVLQRHARLSSVLLRNAGIGNISLEQWRANKNTAGKELSRMCAMLDLELVNLCEEAFNTSKISAEQSHLDPHFLVHDWRARGRRSWPDIHPSRMTLGQWYQYMNWNFENLAATGDHSWSHMITGSIGHDIHEGWQAMLSLTHIIFTYGLQSRRTNFYADIEAEAMENILRDINVKRGAGLFSSEVLQQFQARTTGIEQPTFDPKRDKMLAYLQSELASPFRTAELPMDPLDVPGPSNLLQRAYLQAALSSAKHMSFAN
ncbi:hypothetical protein EW146_g1909 [Bondarzewia mesenterica]|uniref:Uncharacterized protein n=1 Tax=Bondarzewia mesenterica TaxID=1095465 RepID=A0A4S4M288_9AGAM|nr:hypothetical protein EW146_g1909 [Bondarzewia mesenterica]